MKRCPKCNSTYTDEHLTFCLTDGSRLVHGEEFAAQPTLVAPRFELPPTIASSPGPVIEQAPDSKRIRAIPLLLVLVMGLVIGLLITYIALRPQSTSSVQRDVAQTRVVPDAPQPTPNASQPMPSATINSEASKPRQPVSSNTPAQDVTWFVIVGTFPVSDWAGANGRLSRIQAEGFSNAYIVETNEYPNFTPDRLAVVMGPYSASEARRVGSQVHSVTPTIKRGW